MSKQELNDKLKEEAERSARKAQRRKASAANTQSRKQKRITEQTRKQLPPQSPARKRREQEMRRIAEEEQRERRKHKRRGSYIVYYILLAIVAVITLAILSVTVLFNTEQIIISGASDYTDEQIIAASGLNGDENLVKLNLSGVAEKILDKLVTLDKVKVEKKFPNAIQITVERSVPMANISYGGRNYVISHIGRVMKIDEEEEECMRIIGYKPAETVIVGGFMTAEDEEQDDLVANINAAIEKSELTGITAVDITDSLAIVLTYEDRVDILIGSVLQLDEKMRISDELLLNGYIAKTEYVTLDVTDVSRARVRPKQQQGLTASAPEDEESEDDTEEEVGEESENDDSSAEEDDSGEDYAGA